MAKSPKSPETVERLAAALRENLKRRKAQARAQGGEAPESAKTGPAPAAEADDSAERA